MSESSRASSIAAAALLVAFILSAQGKNEQPSPREYTTPVTDVTRIDTAVYWGGSVFKNTEGCGINFSASGLTTDGEAIYRTTQIAATDLYGDAEDILEQAMQRLNITDQDIDPETRERWLKALEAKVTSLNKRIKGAQNPSTLNI
jgi:hypothetical protein